MRIIAGAARGRKIRAPDTKHTRPATDRVREALFSMLGPAVREAAVLDLYAGSGSFGLEALSRGAATATFVESGRAALVALKHNIETLGLGGSVVATTVRGFLGREVEQFEVVFIDPPWDLPTDELEQDMLLLEPFLSPGASVVTSRRSTDDVPANPKTWRLATDRRYGDTRILIYERMAQDQ